MATTAGKRLVIDHVEAFFYELVPKLYSQLYEINLCIFVEGSP